MSVIVSRKEAVKTVETAEAIETAGTGKDGKKSGGDKYPGNLV